MSTHEWLRERELQRYLRAFQRLEFADRKSGGDRTRFEARARMALQMGATVKGAGVLKWDSAPYCLGDVWILTKMDYVDAKHTRSEMHEAFLDNQQSTAVHKALFIDQKVPCRKCMPCLLRRRREWTYRAKYETALAERTWFGTLTLEPVKHYLSSLRFVYNERSSRTAEEQEFSHRIKNIYPEVTGFLKRVRKNSGAKVRYILVVEKHKSGLPHLHVLLHERAGSVTKRELEKSWTWGFSSWRLVDKQDPRVPHYVCKYLSKSMDARVRASIRYGIPQV